MKDIISETEKLVNQAKSGDNDAFDGLYALYSEVLLKFVMKQGLSEFDAQDIVSESFMEAIKHIDQLRENSYFSTWLHKIALRKAQDFLKKENRYQRVSFDTENSEDADLSRIDADSAAVELAYEEAYGDTVMLPADYADNNDVKQIIAEQINTLTPEQKETLFLFYFQGKSIAEIAELTNTNQNNVKARLFHARKNLKEKLKKLMEKGVVLCAVPFVRFVPDFSLCFKGAVGAGAAASAAGTAAAIHAGSASSAAAGTVAAQSGAASSAAAGTTAAAQSGAVSSAAAGTTAAAQSGAASSAAAGTAAGGLGTKAIAIIAAVGVASAVTVGVGAAVAANVFFGNKEVTPWQEQYIQALEDQYGKHPDNLSGVLYDINGDDIPELFIHENHGKDITYPEDVPGVAFATPADNYTFISSRMDTNELILDEIQAFDYKNAQISILGSPDNSGSYLILMNDRKWPWDTTCYEISSSGCDYIDRETARQRYSFDTRACTCISEGGDSYDMVTDFSEWINSWNGNPEPVGTVTFSDTASETDELEGWQKAYYEYITNYSALHGEDTQYAISWFYYNEIPFLFVLPDDYGSNNDSFYNYNQPPQYNSTLVIYDNNGGCNELHSDNTVISDEAGRSEVHGSFVFPLDVHADYISMLEPVSVIKDEGNDGDAYKLTVKEYFYKIENGNSVKQPDEIEFCRVRSGNSMYWENIQINGKSASFDDYLEFRESIFGTPYLVEPTSYYYVEGLPLDYSGITDTRFFILNASSAYDTIVNTTKEMN